MRSILLTTISVCCLLLTGCGSGSGSKPPKSSHHHGLKPTVIPGPKNMPSSGQVVVGTSLVGPNETKVANPATAFPNVSGFAWVARLRNRPRGKSLTVEVVRENGPGTFPRTVWHGSLRGPASSRFVHGSMTATQMRARHVMKGGAFGISVLDRGSILATGTFTVGNQSSGPGGPGY